MLKQLNIRFASVLTLYVGFVLLIDRDEVIGPVLAPLTVVTAKLTYWALSWLGIDAIREGNIIAHPGGFAYEIYYSCTGFVLMLSLTVCILAYPAELMRKVVGIALGLPVLFGLNQLRLVHLYYVGIYAPRHFEYIHHVLWESLMILAIASLWLSWVSWGEVRAWNQSARALSQR